MLINIVLIWTLFNVVSSQKHCANDYDPSLIPCQTKSLQVSRRIVTLRDLAWLLTPHSYLITNGNLRTFSLLHRSLLGSCSQDPNHLSRMRIGAFFDYRNLVLFAEPEWLPNNKSSTPFHHMICTPQVNEGMWYSVYKTLFQLPIRDFDSVSATLSQFAKKDPRILEAIRDFGRFTCKTNPICASDEKPEDLCHPEVDGDCFATWELVLSWTDHISGTGIHTGTGILGQGCLNGEASWVIFSKVHHQGEANMKEVHKQLEGHGTPFKAGEHCWGNYNRWL